MILTDFYAAKLEFKEVPIVFRRCQLIARVVLYSCVFPGIPYPNIVKIITYRITAKEVGRCQIQIQKIPNIFFTYSTGIIRLSFLEKERTKNSLASFLSFPIFHPYPLDQH
jgi:hypothetical protein